MREGKPTTIQRKCASRPLAVHPRFNPRLSKNSLRFLVFNELNHWLRQKLAAGTASSC